MIKFHYFVAPATVPGKVEARENCCHVYSDRAVGELLLWGYRNSFPGRWLHRDAAIPHFDAWGGKLAICGPAVSDKKFAADIQKWRERKEASK